MAQDAPNTEKRKTALSDYPFDKMDEVLKKGMDEKDFERLRELIDNSPTLKQMRRYEEMKFIDMERFHGPRYRRRG